MTKGYIHQYENCGKDYYYESILFLIFPYLLLCISRSYKCYSFLI